MTAPGVSRAQSEALAETCHFSSPEDFALPAPDLVQIEGRINEARTRVRANGQDQQARQVLAESAVTLGQWIERLEASAQEERVPRLADIIRNKLPDTLWRIGHMAKNGNVDAVVTRGTLHRFGILVESDHDKACDFYQQAADLGNPNAAYRAAVCMAEEDPRESLMLMSQAGEGGNASAAVALGLVCLESQPRDDACALAWFCKAARGGRPRAAGMAGWMLEEGRSGFTDSRSALALYRFAAERGDRLAQNNLGKLYEIGEHVEKDIRKAASLYKEAAEAGFGPAQVNIGRLYAEGNGVPFDLERGIYWLKQAEGQGIQQASEILEWMRQNLIPKPDDPPPTS